MPAMTEDIFQRMQPRPSPPESPQALMSRVTDLAGKTLGQIARDAQFAIPDDLSRHKGWVGSLFEHVLGCDAGSQAIQDFSALGIELKTLPLDAHGQPKESTFVCTVNAAGSESGQWQDSWVRKKLSNVLWVPIEADNRIALADRFVGMGWIWRPTAEQEAMLRQDWEELMELIALGEQNALTAEYGQYLQIRPKAANSRVMARASDIDGESILLNPRGFYLRTSFTRQLLETATISSLGS